LGGRFPAGKGQRVTRLQGGRVVDAPGVHAQGAEGSLVLLEISLQGQHAHGERAIDLAGAGNPDLGGAPVGRAAGHYTPLRASSSSSVSRPSSRPRMASPRVPDTSASTLGSL